MKKLLISIVLGFGLFTSCGRPNVSEVNITNAIVGNVSETRINGEVICQVAIFADKTQIIILSTERKNCISSHGKFEFRISGK